MWPRDPDEFIPNHVMPDGADHDDAWYFVFMGGDLTCKTEQGVPTPITAGDYRWFDVETQSKQFLGHHGSVPCFALKAEGGCARGIYISAASRTIGSNHAIAFLSGWASPTDCGLV